VSAPKICPHCLELTRRLRHIGHGIEAHSLHYAMALLAAAREEGRPVRDVIDLLRFLDASDEIGGRRIATAEAEGTAALRPVRA
jgi:hypothetical protein